MTELLDNTRANLPHEINSANELLAFHIYALLKRRATGVHFDKVDEPDDDDDVDEVCYCISVDSPPQEIRVVSLGGISRSVVCVDNSSNDDDIRTAILSLDKYLNVGAFPVKRQTLYRAFRSTDAGEQETKLALLAGDLEGVLFNGGDGDGEAHKPVDAVSSTSNLDIGQSQSTHIPDNSREGSMRTTTTTSSTSRDTNTASLLQAQRGAQTIAKKEGEEDTTNTRLQHPQTAQAATAHPPQDIPHHLTSPPPSLTPAPDIGSGDLNPFQSFTHPADPRRGGVPGVPGVPSGMHPDESLFAVPPGARFDPIGPVFGPSGGVGVGRGTGRGRGGFGGGGSHMQFGRGGFGSSFPADPDFDEPMPPESVSWGAFARHRWLTRARSPTCSSRRQCEGISDCKHMQAHFLVLHALTQHTFLTR